MNFEEALSQLRIGKKIRHPGMNDNEHFMACRIGIIGDETPSNDLPISIVKMERDKIHPDMYPRLPFLEQMDLVNKYPFLREKITFPTISLLLIMSEEWETIE